MFNSLACRSLERSVFDIGVFSNKMYNYAVVFVVTGQLLVTYVPFLQGIFQTESLPISELLLILLVSTSVLWVDEIVKAIIRNGGVRPMIFKLSLFFKSSSPNYSAIAGRGV
jgi:Ca2+-transporting ATPase